jgi:hypothetical protein
VIIFGWPIHQRAIMKQLAVLSVLVVQCASASALSIQMTIVDAGCGNATGSATALVSGGLAPYTFFWAPTPPTGQGTNSAGGLLPGTYWVYVTDGLAVTDSALATISAAPQLAVGASLSFGSACPVNCLGNIFVAESALGGLPPYSITTDPPLVVNNAIVQGVCPDIPITVSIVDALGCTGSATITLPEIVIPSVTGVQQIPGCGPIEGTTILTFDPWIPVGGFWTGPNGNPGPGTGLNGGLAVTGLPGVHTYTVQFGFGCTATYQAIVISSNDCSYVTGSVYMDADDDCIRGPGDLGRSNRMLTIQPGDIQVLTTTTGHFALPLDHGSYTIERSEPMALQTCPGPSPLSFALDSLTPTFSIDMGDSVFSPDIVLQCHVGPAPPRPGFDHQLNLHVQNQSPLSSAPFDLFLTYDTLCLYVGSSSAPVQSDPGSIAWQLSGMAPFASLNIVTTFSLPADPGLNGTQLTYVAGTNLPNDLDTTNSTCFTTRTIVNSWDPNDKQAYTNTGNESLWSLSEDSVVTYTIRFQNTGSAPAITVEVVDTLSTLLDIASLRILGTSHACAPSLSQDRVLRFTFDHINLVDSATYEPASHGFAQFSIRPVAGLSSGQTITNAADIFFDFNPPIRTNTSELFVEFGVGTIEPTNPGLAIHPNPATDQLWVRGIPVGTFTLEITSVDGRLLQRSKGTDDRVAIDRLVPGAYVLKLITWDGEQRIARFVKQ